MENIINRAIYTEHNRIYNSASQIQQREIQQKTASYYEYALGKNLYFTFYCLRLWPERELSNKSDELFQCWSDDLFIYLLLSVSFCAIF